MNYQKCCLPLITVLLILVKGMAAANFQWEQYKEKEGILLYKRSVPGSKMKEFKGVTVMNTKIETIIMILEDFSSYPRWMYGCKEITLVRELDEDNRVIYYIQKTPPLVKDRDVVLRTSNVRDWDACSITVYIYSIRDPEIPLQQKYTRMEKLMGRWFIQDMNREKVKVSFQIMADPGGSVPAFLANSKIGKMPFRTLRKLKEIAKEKKYIEAGCNSGVSEAINEYFAGKNNDK